MCEKDGEISVICSCTDPVWKSIADSRLRCAIAIEKTATLGESLSLLNADEILYVLLQPTQRIIRIRLDYFSLFSSFFFQSRPMKYRSRKLHNNLPQTSYCTYYLNYFLPQEQRAL